MIDTQETLCGVEAPSALRAWREHRRIHSKLDLAFTNETGVDLWAVFPVLDQGFWIAAFHEKKEAEAFIKAWEQEATSFEGEV